MFRIAVFHHTDRNQIGDQVYLPVIPQPPLTITHDSDDWDVVRTELDFPQMGSVPGEPIDVSVYVKPSYGPSIQPLGYEITVFGPDGEGIGEPFLMSHIPDPSNILAHENDEYRIQQITVHMPQSGATIVPVAVDVASIPES